MKKNKMLIDVNGVDAKCDADALMKEIVRRNCKVDPRVIYSMVRRIGTFGEGTHDKRYAYQIELENYDMAGVAKDFELLKMAGVIESVTKTKCYIVH